MPRPRRLDPLALAALVSLALGGSAARAAEPRLRGAKGILRVSADPQRYHLVEPGAALSFTLSGPGELALRLRAIQPSGASGALGTAHVNVDGSDIESVAVSGGHAGRVLGRHDLVSGPLVERQIRIGDGQRPVVITVDNGPIALAVDWAPGPPSLTLAPLVPANVTPPESTGAAGAAEAARPEPPLKLAPTAEPMVPLTVDAPSPHRASWPYFLLAGSLGVAFAGAVVWGVSKNADSTYNTTPEGPTRNAKLSTANDELHASLALAGVAIGLAAAGTIGLVLQ